MRSSLTLAVSRSARLRRGAMRTDSARNSPSRPGAGAAAQRVASGFCGPQPSPLLVWPHNSTKVVDGVPKQVGLVTAALGVDTALPEVPVRARDAVLRRGGLAADRRGVQHPWGRGGVAEEAGQAAAGARCPDRAGDRAGPPDARRRVPAGLEPDREIPHSGWSPGAVSGVPASGSWRGGSRGHPGPRRGRTRPRCLR